MTDTTRKGRRQAKRESGKWAKKRSLEREVKDAGRRDGSELDHYEPKKQPWAIAARRLAKSRSPRKVAKTLGVSVAEVERVLSGDDAA